MKQGSTLFLKAVIVLFALVVLAAMIWLPQLEGRNENGTFVSIYLQDPFLAYLYATSIPFFLALYQGIKLLGYIDLNKAFSKSSVKALKNIKFCAITLGALLFGASYYIFMFAQEDDAPGLILIWLGIIFISFIVATFAAILQKLVQNAVDLKSENDLTV